MRSATILWALAAGVALVAAGRIRADELPETPQSSVSTWEESGNRSFLAAENDPSLELESQTSSVAVGQSAAASVKVFADTPPILIFSPRLYPVAQRSGLLFRLGLLSGEYRRSPRRFWGRIGLALPFYDADFRYLTPDTRISWSDFPSVGRSVMNGWLFRRRIPLHERNRQPPHAIGQSL
jgi:hypothetical protein